MQEKTWSLDASILRGPPGHCFQVLCSFGKVSLRLPWSPKLSSHSYARVAVHSINRTYHWRRCLRSQYWAGHSLAGRDIAEPETAPGAAGWQPSCWKACNRLLLFCTSTVVHTYTWHNNCRLMRHDFILIMHVVSVNWNLIGPVLKWWTCLYPRHSRPNRTAQACTHTLVRRSSMLVPCPSTTRSLYEHSTSDYTIEGHQLQEKKYKILDLHANP